MVERNQVQDKILCEICEKISSETHFGVAVCGGCRAFYKRALLKRLVYYCSSGNCSTLATTVIRCKSCRFRKYETLLDRSKRDRKLREECRLRAITNLATVDLKCSTDIYEKREPFRALANGCSRHGEGWSSEATICKMRPHSSIDLSDDYINADTAISGPFQLTIYSDRNPPEKDAILNTVLLDKTLRCVLGTVQSVTAVSQSIWGDRYAEAFYSADKYPPMEPETRRDELVTIFKNHNLNNTMSVRSFATGVLRISEHDLSVLIGVLIAPYKRMVLWTIQHTDLRSEDGTYVAPGPQKVQFPVEWLEKIFGGTFLRFNDQMFTNFREIGLQEVEKQLLMLIVLFEPDGDAQCAEVRALHCHYTRILVDILKWRCSDAGQLITTCKKLERFFSMFKMAGRHYREYQRALVRAEEDGMQ